MALTTRTLPALMNGISKQPAILRSPDQTEDELNTWGSIATGLSRRPPTETLQKLTGFELGDAMVHHINRDIHERYIVVIDEGSIRVFDEATGEEKTVNAPEGYGYLSASGPNYRAITVADYTFIVNTQVTVNLAGVGADEAAFRASLRFPGGSAPRDLGGMFGDILYNGQVGQYAANPASPGSLTGTVKDITELPDPVCSGCVYKILGAKETSFVSYYVRGDGIVWNETVAPGLNNAIDEDTMPHALIREADGTFTFAPFSWKPRRVGDAETNPNPPFIGHTIRDVFFYQNRLAFLVDESVVFSAAGDYGDFWRRTVLDYIDSDTLAAAGTTTDVAILDYAIPFADGVMLFSRQRQLSLTNGDSGLSAHSLSIQPVTKYVMAPDVRPSPLGSQVHFVTNSSGYGAVQEYTRLAGADPTEAADITAHVPGLLPPGASQLISAPDMDALFVLVRNSPDPTELTRLYTYQFFWDGDKKLQSAWRVWDFGDGKPVSGAYLDGGLTLLMERPDGFYLERMDLTPKAVSEGQSNRIYLDRQEALTGVYDAASDTTTFTSLSPVDANAVRAVRSLASGKPESIIDTTGYVISGNTLTVPGNEVTGTEPGDELVQNGTFDVDTTGWSSASAGLSVVGGRLKVVSTSPPSSGRARQLLTLEPGVTYSVEADVYAVGGGAGYFRIGITADGGEYISQLVLGGQTQHVSTQFVATGTSAYINLWAPNSDGTFIEFDNISVRPLLPPVVTVGNLYTTLMVPSEQFPNDWQGRALTTGRLQMHTFTVNMTDTAYTRAEVYPYGEQAEALNPGLKHIKEFTGKHVGGIDAIIGQRSYWTGPFTFSVAAHSKEVRLKLINDSPFGSTWTSAEWEGLYFNRAL